MKIYLIVSLLLFSSLVKGQSKVLYKFTGTAILQKNIFTSNTYKRLCYNENSRNVVYKGFDEQLDEGVYVLTPVLLMIDTSILHPDNLSFTIQLRYLKNVNGKSKVITVETGKYLYWGVKITGRNLPEDNEQALYGEWVDRTVKLTWTKNKNNLYDYILTDDAPFSSGGFTIISMQNMEKFIVD